MNGSRVHTKETERNIKYIFLFIKLYMESAVSRTGIIVKYNFKHFLGIYQLYILFIELFFIVLHIRV